MNTKFQIKVYKTRIIFFLQLSSQTFGEIGISAEQIVARVPEEK